MIPKRATLQRGFTLMELILALALSAVLLTMLSAALRMAVSRAIYSRGEVEQARVVEGVLGQIAADIRSAAVLATLDTSMAMSLAEAGANFDVDSIDTETLGSRGGGSGSGGGLGGQEAQSISLRRPLGVNGTLETLQIDLLRDKPQLLLNEQGQVVATAGDGGITTVRYSLGEGGATLGSGSPSDPRRRNWGLIRQEANRDLLNWAEQIGAEGDVVGMPVLMASEVERVEFRYFDGYEVFEVWDTVERGGALPRAIEVRAWFLFTDDQGEPIEQTEEAKPYIITVALPTSWNWTDSGSVGSAAGASSESTQPGGPP